MLLPPPIELGPEGVDGAAVIAANPAHWQPGVALPALGGADTASEALRDLLPRLQSIGG